MDVFSAIIVMVPLITPIAARFGIDPVQLGIIFLANLELGYLTPPVGMNLCLSAYRFKQPMTTVYRATLPVYLILLAEGAADYVCPGTDVMAGEVAGAVELRQQAL